MIVKSFLAKLNVIKYRNFGIPKTFTLYCIQIFWAAIQDFINSRGFTWLPALFYTFLFSVFRYLCLCIYICVYVAVELYLCKWYGILSTTAAMPGCPLFYTSLRSAGHVSTSQTSLSSMLLSSTSSMSLSPTISSIFPNNHILEA